MWWVLWTMRARKSVSKKDWWKTIYSYLFNGTNFVSGCSSGGVGSNSRHMIGTKSSNEQWASKRNERNGEEEKVVKNWARVERTTASAVMKKWGRAWPMRSTENAMVNTFWMIWKPFEQYCTNTEKRSERERAGEPLNDTKTDLCRH